MTPAQQAVKALTMSYPVCSAVRWPDYAHCMEASIAGARVLELLGFKAEAVFCSALVKVRDQAFGLGLEGEDIHMIIKTEGLFVDLTLGQIPAEGVPLQISCSLEGVGEWPLLETADFAVGYRASSLSANARSKLERDIALTDLSGLTADLHELVLLALHLGLDHDEFLRSVSAQQPEQFRLAAARLAQL